MAIRLTSYCILINGVWNKISTQTTEMCKKGREFQARGLEISTQMVNNTLFTQFLFCKIVKDKTFISVKHHSDTPFIYK